MKKDFIEVTPDSGTGDGSVSIAAAPNIGLGRQTSFAVKAGSLSETVTVGQEGLPLYVNLYGGVTDIHGIVKSPELDNITQETKTIGDIDYQYLVYDFIIDTENLSGSSLLTQASVYVGYSTYQYFKQLGLDASLPDFTGNNLVAVWSNGSAANSHETLNIPNSVSAQSGITSFEAMLNTGYSGFESGSEFVVGLADSGNEVLVPLVKYRINYVGEAPQVDYTVQITGNCSGLLTSPVTVQIAAVDSSSTTVWTQEFTVSSAGALPAPSASVKIDSKYVNTGYGGIMLQITPAGGPAKTYHITSFKVNVNMASVLNKTDMTIPERLPQKYPLTTPATFTESGLCAIELWFNEVQD